MKSKHPSDLFGCDICDRTFSRRADLSRHLDVHLGIKYHCSGCGRGFGRLYLLMKHQKSCHLFASTVPAPPTAPTIVAITPVTPLNLGADTQNRSYMDAFTEQKVKLAWIESSTPAIPLDQAIKALCGPDHLYVSQQETTTVQPLRKRRRTYEEELDNEVARLTHLLDQPEAPKPQPSATATTAVSVTPPALGLMNNAQEDLPYHLTTMDGPGASPTTLGSMPVGLPLPTDSEFWGELGLDSPITLPSLGTTPTTSSPAPGHSPNLSEDLELSEDSNQEEQDWKGLSPDSPTSGPAESPQFSPASGPDSPITSTNLSPTLITFTSRRAPIEVPTVPLPNCNKLTGSEIKVAYKVHELQQSLKLLEAIGKRFDVSSDLPKINKILREFATFSRCYTLYYDVHWLDADVSTEYFSDEDKD